MIFKDPAKDLRFLLVSCHRAATSRQYASELVERLARESGSPICIWLDYARGSFVPVAWTPAAEPHLPEARIRCTLEPCANNEAAPESALRSMASVPLYFRSCPAGVLVLANRPEGYTRADLEPLLETGRMALLEYEDRRQAEESGLESAFQTGDDTLAAFVHQLRQPLSIIDTCAYFLNMILPDSPDKALAQVSVLQEQVASADRILADAVQSLHPCAESRSLTKPEIAAVQ